MNNISLSVLAFLNAVGFLGVVLVNWLANALPLNGITTAELSDKYPNLFVPAGITFAIWGVIYILLAAFVLYGILKKGNNAQAGAFLRKIGLLFLVTCLANIGWIFAWHYELLALSLVLMLGLLVSLIVIYRRLNVGLTKVAGKERLFVHISFSVYLGWITVATIANVTALLVSVGWNGFGISPEVWTIAVIVVGMLITGVMIMRRSDIYYSLVVIWAYAGIILKRLSDDSVSDTGVVITAALGVAVILAGLAVRIYRSISGAQTV